MVCYVVDIKYFLIFIYVNFIFYLNKKGRSVHVLELRQYSDLSHPIKETQNGIDFLHFFKNDKIES